MRVAVAVALPLVLCVACTGREESSPVEPRALSGNPTIDVSHRRHPRPPPMPVPGGTLWALTIDTPNQARCRGGTKTLPMEIVLGEHRITLIYGFELWPTDSWYFSGTVNHDAFSATMRAAYRLQVAGRFSADKRQLTAKETDMYPEGACIRNWTAVRQ